MKSTILQPIRLTLICSILFMGIYSIAIYGIAQIAPNQGKGETITQNGKRYYLNIGQSFNQDKYFWTRPSAVNYNAAGSGGSNKSNSDTSYLKVVESRIDSFMAHNPEVTKHDIPSDLVTASGSGLDPNISIQAARVQVRRISKIRKINEQKLLELVEKNIEKPLLGLFGPSKINVLKLNIALDNLTSNKF